MEDKFTNLVFMGKPARIFFTDGTAELLFYTAPNPETIKALEDLLKNHGIPEKKISELKENMMHVSAFQIQDTDGSLEKTFTSATQKYLS